MSDYPGRVWSIRHINSLPAELLCLILSHLPAPALPPALLVCRHWAEVGASPALWARHRLVLQPTRLARAEQILALGRLACLQRLEVNGYGAGGRAIVGAEQWAALTSLPRLTCLTLKHCDLSGLRAGALAWLTTRLTSLVLWQTLVRPGETLTLFTSLAGGGAKLRELDIGYSYLDLSSLQPDLLAAALSHLHAANLRNRQTSRHSVPSYYQTH